jgi:hypothetical protein
MSSQAGIGCLPLLATSNRQARAALKVLLLSHHAGSNSCFTELNSQLLSDRCHGQCWRCVVGSDGCHGCDCELEGARISRAPSVPDIKTAKAGHLKAAAECVQANVPVMLQ